MKHLVIGAGLTGAVIARELADNGHEVIVYEASQRPGGLCRTYKYRDMLYDMGPHSFHTNNRDTWRYVNRFCAWKAYNHWARAEVGESGQLVDWPVNRNTYDALGIDMLATLKEACPWNPRNFEEAAISKVGRSVYNLLIADYTRKFWGCDPKELDAGMAKRLDPRSNRDNRFFTEKYQGVPVNGFSSLIGGMLKHKRIKVSCGRKVDGLASVRMGRYKRVYYTGCPDEALGFVFGAIPYRGVAFRVCRVPVGEGLPCPSVNHGHPAKPYIRETDYRYIYPVEGQKYTTIVKEQVVDGGARMYPVPSAYARRLWWRYAKEITGRWERVVLCGRLGMYEHLNMDRAVEEAIRTVKETV